MLELEREATATTKSSTQEALITRDAWSWLPSTHRFRERAYKPVSQSCAVAKSDKFWRATGQSNLADRIEDCSTGQSAVVWVGRRNFWSFCCLPEVFIFSCCAWLWNWLIKIKIPWSFAHVVRRDQVNRLRNTDHAARTRDMFVYSIVKNKTRLYHYQTWQRHFEKFTRCAKICGLFFRDCASRMLIGWAGKLITCFVFQLRSGRRIWSRSQNLTFNWRKVCLKRRLFS